MMDHETTLRARGKYRGECRKRHNILEQWDGKAWRRVPDVIIEDRGPSRMHFDVEDSLRPEEDAVDRAFISGKRR